MTRIDGHEEHIANDPESPAIVACAVTRANRLEKVGERVDVPGPSPARGPPCWRGVLLRRKAGDVAAA